MGGLLSKIKMREKMVLLAVSGIVLTALVLWSVFYSVSHAAYKQKINQITEETISQTAKYLDNELTHILQIAHGGLIGYNVSEVVYGSNLEDPLVRGRIEQMLTQFRIQNTLITSAHLVYQGQKISNLNCRGTYDMVPILKKAFEQPMIYWGDQVIQPDGNAEKIIPLVIKIPDESHFLSNEYDSTCILVIDLSFTEIMNTLWEVEEQIYGEVQLLNQQDVPFAERNLPDGDSKIYVQTVSIPINGWEIQSVQREKVLLSEFYDLQGKIFVAFFALIVLFISLACLLAKSITKPLLKLTQVTKKLQSHDYSQDIPIQGDDEISQLAQELNCLQQRLVEYEQIVEHDKQVIRNEDEEKRKIEIRLLQSQINPHFLYNTMDSMYWYSVDQNSQKVGQLILNLSAFFRLSLSKGEEMVSVKDEVQHVETYLKIQKIIFGDKFTYTVNTDPAVLDKKVIKILLQPLVENSILHGFADVESGGEIEVNVYGHNGGLIMQVLDNGCGFRQSPESGFALSNIQKRLLYKYGDKAQLVIERTLIGMTKVEIRILQEDAQQ